MSNHIDRRNLCCAWLRAGLILGSLALVALPAAAVTVVLEPVRDNSIYEVPATSSNGAGPELFSGRTDNFFSGGLRRALMEFDVAGSIPPGATINSASLRLTVIQAGPSSSPTQLSTLHKLTADWGEGNSGAGSSGNGTGSAAQTGADATWTDSFYMTTSWATAGGDFLGTASASFATPTFGAVTIPTSAGLVADVVEWLANPGANHGWILNGDEGAGANGTARRFHSRESATIASRPQLVIDYTVSATAMVTLEPVRDNSLYEYDGSKSNGAGPELFSGRTDNVFPGGLRRALMEFDVAGAIPSGSTILNASLVMTVNNSGPSSSPVQLSTLHRLTADWGEGNSGAGSSGNGPGSPAEAGADATWTDSFYMTTTWATPGGDFVGASSASFATPTFGPVTVPSNPSLVADVAAWLATPAANHGWILNGDESPGANGTARRWHSRESTVTASRPQLTIEYIPGTGGGSRGSIPDGDDLPGTPLTVDKLPGNDVQLSWSSSCKTDDTDYGVYEGAIGTWYGHGPVVCTTAGTLTHTMTVASAGAYLLVVPNDGTDEGSYGDDSADVERPTAGSACLPQNIGAPVCP